MTKKIIEGGFGSRLHKTEDGERWEVVPPKKPFKGLTNRSDSFGFVRNVETDEIGWRRYTLRGNEFVEPCSAADAALYEEWCK